MRTWRRPIWLLRLRRPIRYYLPEIIGAARYFRLARWVCRHRGHAWELCHFRDTGRAFARFCPRCERVESLSPH